VPRTLIKAQLASNGSAAGFGNSGGTLYQLKPHN